MNTGSSHRSPAHPVVAGRKGAGGSYQPQPEKRADSHRRLSGPQLRDEPGSGGWIQCSSAGHPCGCRSRGLAAIPQHADRRAVGRGGADPARHRGHGGETPRVPWGSQQPAERRSGHCSGIGGREGLNCVMSLEEAVRAHVPDGSSLLLGACLESVIPFAAGHEIIRQRRRDLTLIGPISDILFDQIIGAGCVSRVIAAWIGNVSAGLAHSYRRAVEDGVPRPLEVREHSNLSLGLALMAAGVGSPFIPTRTLLGTDLPSTNPDLIVTENPLAAEEPIVLVRAVSPDVAVFHVQKADEEGRGHLWGNLGVAREGALAADKIILTCEEIRPASELTADPNRVL